MASLLSLPDELIARIFRFLREYEEKELLQRILDPPDRDGAVALPARNTLRSLPLLSKKLFKLGQSALCHTQHVWDPLSLGSLALYDHVHPLTRSIRIDLGEALSSTELEAVPLAQEWIALLHPLLPLFATSPTQLKHLHLAFPRDDANPSNSVIAGVAAESFIPSTGLHTLSIKSGGPMSCFNVLKTFLRDPSRLEARVLRLEAVTARDFVAVPQDFQPFIQVQHLVLFDIFNRASRFYFDEGGIAPFLDLFQRPSPTALTITKTRLLDFSQLSHLLEALGPGLQYLHLSLSELEGRTSSRTLEALHPYFLDTTSLQANESGLVADLLRPCTQLATLKIRMVDWTPLEVLQLPHVSHLCLTWNTDLAPAQYLYRVLQNQPSLTRLTLEMVRLPPRGIMYPDRPAFNDDYANEQHLGMLACGQYCQQRGIQVEYNSS